MHQKSILILGGGYGGHAAVRGLSGRLDPTNHTVTLIDASEFHEIKTRYHELAVSCRRDFLMRAPHRELAAAHGAEFIRGKVNKIDFRKQVVETDAGNHPWDRLIIALGGCDAFRGVRGAKQHTERLLTYDDAIACCRRIETLKLQNQSGPLRAVICGAGLAGIEVAAMMRQYFTRNQCDILLLEAGRKIMGNSLCGPSQRRHATRWLRRRGIALRLNSPVKEIRRDSVLALDGDIFPADIVIWCGGFRRNHVSGITKDAPFEVDQFLQSIAHPGVFALGDFARIADGGPTDNLFSAQRAIYQGGLAAVNVVRSLTGKQLLPARYKPVGELTALGDTDGFGIVEGIPIEGPALAMMKKANEAKYLVQLLGPRPGRTLRKLLDASL